MNLIFTPNNSIPFEAEFLYLIYPWLRGYIGVEEAMRSVNIARKVQFVVDALGAVVRRGIPQWLELEKENFKGVVKSLPVREDITMPIQEQLIVELYSK